MLISKTFNYIALSHGYGSKKSEIETVDLTDVSAILFLGGKKKASKLSSLNLEMVELDKGVYEVKGGFIQILIIEIDHVNLSINFDGLKIFANEQIRKKTMTEAIQNDNIFIKSLLTL